MAYTNGNGQTRVGVRVPGVSPVITASTLLTSLYSVWNGDTLGTTLDSSIYGAWNGDVLGTSLDTSIYAVYNAENNANDSFGTKHGTTQGGLTYTTGKVGTAFQFNGSNAYIQLPNNSFNFTGDFSVSLWVNFPSMSWQNGQLIDNTCYSANGGTSGWRLYYLYGSLGFYNYRDNNMVQLETYQLNQANVWYHVVITSSSSGMKIYLNGSLSTSNTNTQIPNYPNTVSTRLGASRFDNQFFTGKMDSVNVWNREITANEVSNLYNLGGGVEYPFSSKTLPSTNDSVGTNHGTLVGGMTYVDGKNGKAFQFNGTNAYVSFPTNSWNSLVGTDLTISLWVRFASTSNQTLISNMSSPGVNVWNGWEIRLVSGQPTFYSWNNSGTGQGVVGSTVAINTWYHIVATKRGSSYKIYMNGSLVSTGSGTGDAIVNASFYPNIGHLQYSASFHAIYVTNGTLIDSVNLWSKEISADEVTQLYNGGNGTQYPYSSKTLPSVANQLGVDNGNPVGGLTFTNGLIGKAFTGNGTNAYVQLPNNSCNFTGDFSINMWFNLATTSVDFDLFANVDNLVGNTRSYGYRILYSGVSSLIRVHIYGSSEVIIDSPYTSSTNNWVMVTFIRKASTGSKVYINGSLISSNTSVVNPLYTGTFAPCIGAIKSVTSGYLAKFLSNGSKIDSVNVWQKELTGSEVTELYNSGVGKQLTIDTKIVTSGLVLNLDAWRTSSYPNSGTTWTDISGNSLNGTLTNGVGYTASNGGVMTFDGINDYVSLPDSSTLQPSNITISTWFKLNQYGTSYVYGNANSCLIRKGMYGYEISVRQDGKLLVFAYSDVNNQNQYLIDSISLNTWYNVVLTFGSSQMKVYINNSLVGTYATNTNSIYYAGGGISIGRQGPWDMYYFNGSIGQTMVYNRALTTTEITQNFNATKSRFGL